MTATKLACDGTWMTFEEQLESLGCGRIEVKPNGYMTFAKLKYKAKMDFEMAINSNRLIFWLWGVTLLWSSEYLRTDVFL